MPKIRNDSKAVQFLKENTERHNIRTVYFPSATATEHLLAEPEFRTIYLNQDVPRQENPLPFNMPYLVSSESTPLIGTPYRGAEQYPYNTEDLMDGQFDAVFLQESPEELTDILPELMRVTREGGLFVAAYDPRKVGKTTYDNVIGELESRLIKAITPEYDTLPVFVNHEDNGPIYHVS